MKLKNAFVRFCNFGMYSFALIGHMFLLQHFDKQTLPQMLILGLFMFVSFFSGFNIDSGTK